VTPLAYVLKLRVSRLNPIKARIDSPAVNRTCKRVGYVVANSFTRIAQGKAAPAKNIVGTFDELAWNPSPILHIEAETDNQAVLINPGPKIELQLLGGRRLFFSSSRR